MRKIISVLVALASATVLSAASSHALDPQLKAKALKGEFVTAYDLCTVPNTMTDNGIPACQPPVRSDPVCGFMAKGKGQLQLKVKGDDLVVAAKASGLDPGCEGETLTLTTSYSGATDACAGTECTTIPVQDQPIISCVVVGGKCAVKTSLRTANIIPPSPYLWRWGWSSWSWWRYPFRTLWMGNLIAP